MVERRVSLLPILSVNFIGSLGFSIVLPFLVFLVTRWGGNALVYGVMGATYSAFQLVGAPILGRWSDAVGRRKVLLLSQLGTLVSWGIFLTAFFVSEQRLFEVENSALGTFAITLPLLVLFLARAVDGLTGGNISVANAYLADVTREEERSADFGKMAIASNLGFVLGPAIAGLLAGSAWGEILPVLAAMSISFVATLIIAFKLPESRPCALVRDLAVPAVGKTFGQEPRECIRIHETPVLTFRALLRLRCVALLLTLHFLVMLGFNFFYVAFPMHAVRGLRWTVIETGLFFSVLSLAMVFVQGPVLSRLSKRVSDSTLIVSGSLILAASFLFFNSVQTWSVYAGLLPLALGNGLMWPSVLSVMSKVAGSTHQGAVQGVAGSGSAVASMLGMVAGGLLYGAVGSRVFLVSAFVILVVCLIATSTTGRVRRAAAAAAS